MQYHLNNRLLILKNIGMKMKKNSLMLKVALQLAPFDQPVAGRRPQQKREQQQEAGGDPAGPARKAQQKCPRLSAQKACPNPI